MAGKTKFKEEYSKQMLEYFTKPIYEEVLKSRTYDSDGNVKKEEYQTLGSKLPQFIGFALKLGFSRDTLHYWSSQKDKDGNTKNKIFSDTYKTCKQIQKKMLIDGGLLGLYNATAYIFTAKNITDMRDKQEIDNIHKFGTMTDDELDNKILEKVMNIIK